ncbi:MAG: two-component regulator propeller domain-containing protein, partial [Chitinophagales bacterium]
MKEFGFLRSFFPVKQWLLLCFFAVPVVVTAQKYNFQNFNVQHGLVQSQVNGICQDGFDNLWIATLGGISRFDGKTFSSFTETEGLINNFTNCIKADHAGNIWIGTNGGLSRFNGVWFTNYRFSDYPNGNFVNAVEEDGHGQIWIKVQFRLYTINAGRKVLKEEITGPNDVVSAIAVDSRGVLWAALFKKGIFRRDGKQWVKVIGLNAAHEQDFFRQIIFDREKDDRLFLLCKDKLVSAEGDTLMEKQSLFPPVRNDFYQDLFQDESKRLWLLSRQGLFLWSDDHLIPFNETNGYIHNNATAIFQDREKNIWFGTNGSGILRYSYQPFLVFDEFSASRDAIVMSLVEGNDHRLYIGTDGAGLFVYDDKKMIPLKLPGVNPQDNHIVNLSRDNQNNIYVLSASGRIWKFDQHRFTEIKPGVMLNCANAVLPDSRGGLWIAGCLGCGYL